MIKQHQTILKTTIILIWLCPYITCKIAHAQSWWNAQWKYRRTIIYKPANEQSAYKQTTYKRTNQPDACVVSFLTGGAINPDGSDIRVLGQDGKIRKTFILSIGPGDIVRLAFQAKGTKKHRYYIYYGNPKAKFNPENENWRPKSGLLLETYKYSGGTIGSAHATKATVERAIKIRKKPIGRAYISAIFIPGNIFNNERKICNLYSGNLICKKDGIYHFVISSYDACALYIDGKLVIAWPGKHRWIGDIRHNREISLSSGVHKLELYHVNLSGRGGAVVAWKVPGAASFRILDERNFQPIVRGYLGELKKQKKDITADFVYHQENYANMPKRTLFEYKFISLPAENKARRRREQYIWDFGDGQIAVGQQAKHVFLKEGLYNITFQKRFGSKSDTIINRIYVGPNRANWKLRPVKLKTFLPIISTYDFTKIGLSDIPAIIEYFQIVGQNRKAIEAGRKAILAHKFSKNKKEYKAILTVANQLKDLIIDEFGDYKQAEKLLQNLAERVDTSETIYAELTAQACSILINRMGKDELAEALLKSCPDITESPKNKTEKLLAIVWGDLYRLKGNYSLAKRFYLLAESANFENDKSKALATNNPILSFIKTGSYATACEYYLQRREYSAVRKILNRWQWQFPTDKLGGYSCYIRYRLYYAQRQNRQAELIAKIMKQIAPFGLYTRLITKK